MATEKDRAFVNSLLENTNARRIKWEPTAAEEQFAATFRGKYVVLIDKGHPKDSAPNYWLTLKDTNSRELLTVYNFESPAVERIYDAAARAALSVDEAIDEILDDLSR